MQKRSIVKRIVCYVLCLSLLVSTLSGCGKLDEGTEVSVNVDVTQIAKEITASITEEHNEYQLPQPIDAVALSCEWEDYVGDLETFVYGLISNELSYGYDTFPAFAELTDGTVIYGIGYSDYSECYSNEDETKTIFTAGFLPYYGEEMIPDEEFESGLELHDMDYVDETSSFVWTYKSDSYMNHCVVYGQYLTYGVNEFGQIDYHTEDYVAGYCNEELGSLYSYDAGRFVFENQVGEAVPLTGVSLFSQIDYGELEAEINHFLETQDKNMVVMDIESAASFAQEAVEAYLLGMQEETFLGYDVKSLLAEAEKLDPTECYRITNEGLMTLTIEPIYKGGESTLVKWLIGSACIIVTAVGMVSSMVFIECPPLSALSGAVTGLAIEIFMQVVISNETLDELDWKQVALAATAGALSGLLGPYVYATTSGAGYFFADSALDGLIGGMEKTVGAWMNGEDGVDIAKSFGMGVALGFGLSAAFKGVGAAIGKLSSRVAPSLAKTAEKLFPKLSKGVSSAAKKMSGVLMGLKAVADSTPFHSKFIAKKISFKQLARLQSNGSERLKKKSLSHLKSEGITDVDHNPISKKALEKVFDNAKDGSVIGYFDMGDEIIEIVKKNGMVGVLFDNSKYQTVFLEAGLVANRTNNFKEAAKELKKAWVKDSSLIPESVSIAIKETGKELEDLESDYLVKIIKKSDFVMHENIDMKSISLVNRELHEFIKHMGGYALAKDIKYHMGVEFFDRFVSAAASDAVIAVTN